MLEVANLLSSILVTPVTELCIRSLKRLIGYIVHCEENLKQLKEKVKELEETRNNVNRFVTAAERNNEHIFEVVKAWLKEVEKETSNIDDESLLDAVINSRCWCSCASGSRYNLGKRAKNKLVTIEKLLVKGKSFNRDNISEPCVAMSTNPIPTNDFMSFASRDHLRDQVMAELQNEGTNLIGVHGMGGVGKTTFVTQVYNQMKEDMNIFDDVVMVKNITKDVDLKQVQNDIAEGLGFEDIKKADNTLKRAEMLFDRLKKKRTLVILDDLWSHLNFSKVGIPCGGSCNVIITTRRLEVCTSYDSIVPIKIDRLSEVDSWHLFKKMNVGDLEYPPDLEKTAREIANECGGLPVAIVTLAKGLREKAMDVWKNTLRQLKNSKVPHIEEIEGKVYTPIKLSYDYLEKPVFQNYFLLCSLFPRAHKIYIPDLMAYLIADDGIMSEDEYTLEQMTDEVSTILAKLVDSSLLLRGEDPDDPDLSAVSIHDVIRDVAINIASEEGNDFLVKVGLGLKHWPTKSLLSSTTGNGKCLRRLSLMKNEISSLPDDPPELPHLLSLSLYENTSLKEIPNSFFERMKSLATLDLRQTGISFLPSSFSSLVNLKTLYLNGCKFIQPSDINVIGKLKKLEILSLANCGLLSGLPEELRELTNLRLLNVESNYSRGFTIPRNVIGCLSRLEYLNTMACKISWEFEGWGDGRNASLEEVLSLRYLSGLRLDFWSNMVNPLLLEDGSVVSKENQNLICGHVNYFSISFSDATTGILMMSSDPMFEPPRPSICYVDVLPPVCCPIKVLIQRVEILRLRGGLKSLGQLGGGFNNMKELVVKYCKEMEYLMSVEEAETESLKVSYCKGLKDVVTFSRLRRMELTCLPLLENIWKGHNIPFGCFENLEEMEVSDCEKLRYLFSPFMARNLQNMKKLEISKCKSMVKLISSIDQQMVYEDDGQPLWIIFPKLRILDIKDCENLKQLWEIEKNLKKEDDDDNDQLTEQSSILDFPTLESLKVIGCKNLKRIRLTRRCTKQLKEIEVDDDEWCQRIEWEETSDKLRLQSLFQQLGSIPNMVQGVWSDNFELQLEFTTQFRKFLSSENFDRIEKVIKACVVPRFVEFLERKDLPQLQHEAEWALTIITSGTSEHTQVVIDHDDVRKKALSALGCVDGGSPRFRYLILGQGALLPLMSQFNEHTKLSMLRNATLILSEFCETQPPFEQVKLVLLALRHLIHSTDEQILTDACRGLSHLYDKIQAVIEAGVFPRLVDLLLHPSYTIVLPALAIVRNIVVYGDDAQKQYVFENYQVLLPCLYQLLSQNRHENIKKEACWISSNITAGKNNRGHRIQAGAEPEILVGVG